MDMPRLEKQKTAHPLPQGEQSYESLFGLFACESYLTEFRTAVTVAPMKRFYDFPADLWSYFLEVDQRFNGPATTDVSPAAIAPRQGDLPPVKAVLWDVYGTLCSLDYGDMEKTLQWDDILQPSARATIEEFNLGESLRRRFPDAEPGAKLVELLLEQINHSHQASRDKGIEHPEVVIERIWQHILEPCRRAGFAPCRAEPELHTAYRVAYFFDASLQKMALFDGMASCLWAFKEAGIVQGIISNAQFYTPIRLRRLLRLALDQPDFELDDVFTESLVLFSHELGFSKPNPGGFRIAVKALGERHITPAETLYIGNDMLNDMTAAQQAGLGAVLFAVDDQVILREDDPRCRDTQPDGVVHHASQISGLILNK